MSNSQLLRDTQILEVSTSKLQDLGATAETKDGRRFRYAKAGEALSAGDLVRAAANVANHLNAAAATTAAGAEEISVTLGATAVAADDYAGGLLVVNAGTGKGQQFKIIGNTKAASSGVTRVKIAGALKTALDTSDSKVSLFPNRYNGVTDETTAALRAVGVCPRDFASGDYGWLQVGGPCGVLNEGSAIALADPVIPSTSAAGAVAGIGSVAATDQIVGFALYAGADGEVRPVDLTIE